MTSLVFDNVSTVFASSTFYKDGFNPSTNKIQPGFKTPTTATVSTSAGIRTRIPTQSPPAQNPTATDIYRERMTTAKSEKTLIPSPEHIPLSSSFQQNTTLQMFSHFITQQSSQSMKQSPKLHTPTTIDLSLESMNILKSATKLIMITKQEHIPTSSLPQRNTTVEMYSASVKPKPTKTSQQQLMPSHSTSTKGNFKYVFELLLFLISALLETVLTRKHKAKRQNHHVGLIP